MKLVPIKDQCGRLTGRMISLHGITARKPLEEEQVRTQRLRAIDGQDALAMFVPDKYEVALIDLGMPAFSVYQVAEQVKQKDPLMVTVLITGWELKEGDPRLSLFDFQISKPFTSEEIEDIVGWTLNLYNTRVLKRAGQIAIRSSS